MKITFHDLVKEKRPFPPLVKRERIESPERGEEERNDISTRENKPRRCAGVLQQHIDSFWSDEGARRRDYTNCARERTRMATETDEDGAPVLWILGILGHVACFFIGNYRR